MPSNGHVQLLWYVLQTTRMQNQQNTKFHKMILSGSIMKKSLITLAAIFAVFACSKEVSPVEGSHNTVPTGYKSLTISAEVTKVAIADDGKSAWESGDFIAVYDGTGINKFELTDGAGSATAEFTGLVADNATDIVAVYPYEAAVVKDNALEVLVPATQTIASRSCAVMKATGSVAAPSLVFAPTSAVVRFTVPAGVDMVVFSTAKGFNLASGSEQLEVVLPNANGGTFEASVIAGTYKMFNAFVRKDGKFYAKEATNDLVLADGVIKNLTTIDSDEEAVLIRTKAELDAFAAAPSTSAYLCADIDFEGGAFTPIAEFSKTFNGQNHNLYRFNMSFASDASGVVNDGLFTKLNGATVKNLEVGNYTDKTGYSDASGVSVNAHSAASSINAAVVAGEISGATIKNVKSYAWISIGGDCGKLFNVGGISGLASGSPSTIENCYQGIEVRCNGTYSTASPYPMAGGILGYDCAGCSIKSCVNDAAIISNCIQVRYFGGIVGRHETSAGNSVIEGCTNNGVIEACAKYASKLYAGGITSFMGTSGCEIKGCTNTAKIYIHPTANADKTDIAYYIGGIAGSTKGSITNCTNEGSVKYELNKNYGKPYMGGICGSADAPLAISGCTNMGDVTISQCNKPSYQGGIIGYVAANTCIISDCTVNDCTITPGRAVKNAFVGGIAGYINNTAANGSDNFAACKVDCTCVGKEATNAGIGMIIGGVKNSATNGIVCGTVAKPVLVKGTYGINALAVTAANCLSTIFGQGYVSGDADVTTGGAGTCITYNVSFWN